MTTQRIDIGGFEPDAGTSWSDPSSPPDSASSAAAAAGHPGQPSSATPIASPIRITWDDLAEELPADAPGESAPSQAMSGPAAHAATGAATGAAADAVGNDPEDDPLGDDDVAYASGDPPRLSNRERARARAYRPPYEQPKRKPAAERDESFNALLWLVDGATGLVEELRHSDLGLSEDFWVHASAARREGLLAARALLDQFIAATEDEKAELRGQAQRRARRGGINVDF